MAARARCFEPHPQQRLRSSQSLIQLSVVNRDWNDLTIHHVFTIAQLAQRIVNNLVEPREPKQQDRRSCCEHRKDYKRKPVAPSATRLEVLNKNELGWAQAGNQQQFCGP
jgi:hypothetical protein